MFPEILSVVQDYLRRFGQATLSDIAPNYPEHRRYAIYQSLDKLVRSRKARSEIRQGNKFWIWLT